MKKGKEIVDFGTEDPIADALNRKLEKQGSTKRIVPDSERFSMITTMNPMNSGMEFVP